MPVKILIIKQFPSPPFCQFLVGGWFGAQNLDLVQIFPDKECLIKFWNDIHQGACQLVFVEVSFLLVCWLADVAIHVDEIESSATDLVRIVF